MKALLVIDIQNDFLPGGSLAVPEGDQIIPLVNELMPEYPLVIATQDWHPDNHGSFAKNHPNHQIGDLIQLDYSGFHDNGHRKATGLAKLLKEKGVSEIHLCGLATDYCVKFTALDALQEGFKVTLIEDATRGVNLNPNDVSNTLAHLKSKGIEILNSKELKGTCQTRRK